MEKIFIPENCASPDNVDKVVACLRGNAVIAAPTETVFGLMTLWQNEGGRKRIFAMKGRTFDKPLQMLAADLKMATAAGVRTDKRIHKIAETFWPGPLTVVLPANRNTTIGLRIPDHPLILSLLKALGTPLAATSANLSGRPPALRPEEVADRLKKNPDLLITGRPAPGGKASTVVSLLSDGWKLLREGPVTTSELTDLLGKQISS
ncbi:MAG: L-threonylcarbamoyladenylate synthase [Lentisphaeria bacterium]